MGNDADYVGEALGGLWTGLNTVQIAAAELADAARTLWIGVLIDVGKVAEERSSKVDWRTGALVVVRVMRRQHRLLRDVRHSKSLCIMHKLIVGCIRFKVGCLNALLSDRNGGKGVTEGNFAADFGAQ